MRVVEIEIQDGQRRYVVMDEDGELVEPIVRYLKYLDCVGSARLTLRSYAYSLKLYWEYLTQQHLNWQQVTLDDLSRFVLWLKLPSGSLKVPPAHPIPQARSNRIINHALTVVRSFYDYHWRLEGAVTNVKDTTTTYLPARARRYKSFLHHITKGLPVEKNILKQKQEMATGLKSTRKTSMNVSSQLLPSSNRATLLQRRTSRSANTPTKNGSNAHNTTRRMSMSEKTWERNTTGIAAHAQKCKEQKRKSVEEAIAALLREHKPVNFHTVAKRATVSKAYLYSQPDLRERIDVLSSTLYISFKEVLNFSS